MTSSLKNNLGEQEISLLLTRTLSKRLGKAEILSMGSKVK